MRLRFGGLLIGLGMSFGLGALPAQAQISEAQVGALVEALRQAAPQTATPNDGLYSQWQVKPENIPRWSRSCIGRELTPTEFEDSPVTARGILVCVMQDVLEDEYQASGNNEALAVRRAASWWMTGDPTRYGVGNIAEYTQRVLGFYQQQRAGAASSNQASSAQPSSGSPSATPSTPSRPSSSTYDRYMRAGYAATQQRDYDTALLYFNRALDERPDDPYAEQAIQNVDQYRQRAESEEGSEQSPSEEASE